MIRAINEAHGVIADTVWWLKGFAAARPPSSDESDGSHLWLRDQLGEVREWLCRVEQASVRRIGDEEAIVLRYGEFEQIYDALAHPGGALEDRLTARTTVKRILSEYQRDVASANPEVPF